MPDAGLFSLANLGAGLLGATLTGPLGGIDLPRAELDELLAQRPAGFAATVSYGDASPAGHLTSGSMPTDIADLPDTFLRAVMAVEDKRFGQHRGVDPLATASAALSVLQGEFRGGSTLSQQAIKNMLFGGEVSLVRKVAEVVLSVRAHVDHTPEEVFEAYLNVTWFGRGVTGAAHAPQAWFGKDWAELSLGQTAFLAALLKGAGHFDPVRFPERAVSRRDHVIDRMEVLGWVSAAEAEAARAEPLDVIPVQRREDGDLWAARAAGAEMAELGLDPDIRARPGLELDLTIDPRWQRIATQALRDGVQSLAPRGPAGTVSAGLLRRLRDTAVSSDDLRAVRAEAARVLSRGRDLQRVILIGPGEGAVWEALSDTGAGLPRPITVRADRFPEGYTPRPGHILPARMTDEGLVLELVPELQGAAIVLNTRNGEVLASVGGYDPDLSEFDRTRAQRQPGSAIKPFLWLAALDLGFAHDSLVTDFERDFIDDIGEVWRPQNYDRSQSGFVPLYQGLERSSNLAAVNIADTIGIEAMAAMAERFGAYPRGGMHRTLSSALGSTELQLRDFVAAYAGLVNDGVPVTPHVVKRAAAESRILWERPAPAAEFSGVRQPALDDLLAMLRGVVLRGTAFQAFQGHPVAVIGKTGTSQLHRDAWFIALTPDIAVGVWLGRDDSQPIPGRPTGGTSAAPISAEILRAAHAEGLIDTHGMRGRAAPVDWPPTLLSDQDSWMAGAGQRHFLDNGDRGRSGLEPDTGDFQGVPRGSGEVVIRSLY